MWVEQYELFSISFELYIQPTQVLNHVIINSHHRDMKVLNFAMK